MDKQTEKSPLDGEISLNGDLDRNPATDDATSSPIGGATDSPVDGATVSPEDGATSSPIDGATSSPKDGATPSPIDGVTNSPKDGATSSPKDDATPSTIDDATNSPIDGATASLTVACTTVASGSDDEVFLSVGAEAFAVTNDTVQRILGTIFGQCSGDAIGLLTEFLTKKECDTYYKTVKSELEYYHKEIVCDGHRTRWKVGDWTDDTDQMILILLSLIETRGKVDIFDYGRRIKGWCRKGFPELGDFVGMGQGKTTSTVLNNPNYVNDPHAAADLVWTANGKKMAANGAVMRTSILGVHMYADIDLVVQNAIAIAKTTHGDPRCWASAVAVCVAIALMLQRQPKHLDKKGNYNIKEIINESYDHASKCLETEKEKKELKTYLKCTKLKELKLDESGKIGYTYKSMGSAFWALKQDNFRKAITKIVMQGGDADSNACVAGAMLGCKLGVDGIPECWTQKLLHKEWLEAIIDRYFRMMAKVHHIDFTPYWRKQEEK
ncbi:ADP-ribosyl-[dinitrogen reductase] glycohydrolase-like [Argopecten irradians]|uniref:ADP-ribosyl-[dinitrogen reductase] glycohydrolase-like n=1 Tax=Argopecten irradians TaxID=31199 RepID=UPI003718EECB